MSEADRLEGFRHFVERSRWRFAKTYVDSYPHEYTLLRWAETDALADAIACIEELGVVEPFWGSRRKYLHLDDRKYWHMGDAGSSDSSKRPTLINRAWLDVSRYREEAAGLGYEGEDLGRLVRHWEFKLVQARGE
jgi:hypothetical protein